MSIRRGHVPSVDQFTSVPNDWARDDRLSLKARGLLTYLLSHREGWEISGIRELVRRAPEGREAVTKAVQELEQLGYLVRTRSRTDAGRLSGVDYVVSDPALAGKPVPGKPSSGEEVLAGKPVPGKPVTGKPAAGNPNTKKNISSEDHLEEDQNPSSSEAAAPRADVESLCRHLADRIEGNGARRPPIAKGWREAARLLLDRDGVTPQQAHWLIDWCQADPFWRANVLSMPKFRTQFDQLRLRAMADYESKRADQRRPNGKPTSQDKYDAAMRAAESLEARVAPPRQIGVAR